MMGYRLKTAFQGLSRLAALPEVDNEVCIDAYRCFLRTHLMTHTTDHGTHFITSWLAKLWCSGLCVPSKCAIQAHPLEL
jgi:hypothetical protein